VDRILAGCESKSSDPVELLQDVYSLMTTGPARICDRIKPSLSRDSLQHLLDAGAFESAALRLLEKCGLMLSRSADGMVIASVVLPSDDRDYSFSAFSECNALCGALMSCLVERAAMGRQD
jgi:hypothetical protein